MTLNRNKWTFLLPLLLIIMSMMALFNVDPSYSLVKKYAKVTEINGKATIQKNGDKDFSIFKGMTVSEGDLVTTGASSKVILWIDETKTVTIGENSKVDISLLKTVIKGTKTSMKLLSGSVYVDLTKKLGQDEKFDIKTPTAVLGVRGTKFYVNLKKDLSKSLEIGVLEGTVNAKYQIIDKAITVEKNLTPSQAVTFMQSIRTPEDIKVHKIIVNEIPREILIEIRDLPKSDLQKLFTPEDLIIMDTISASTDLEPEEETSNTGSLDEEWQEAMIYDARNATVTSPILIKGNTAEVPVQFHDATAILRVNDGTRDLKYGIDYDYNNAMILLNRPYLEELITPTKLRIYFDNGDPSDVILLVTKELLSLRDAAIDNISALESNPADPESELLLSQFKKAVSQADAILHGSEMTIETIQIATDDLNQIHDDYATYLESHPTP